MLPSYVCKAYSRELAPRSTMKVVVTPATQLSIWPGGLLCTTRQQRLRQKGWRSPSCFVKWGARFDSKATSNDRFAVGISLRLLRQSGGNTESSWIGADELQESLLLNLRQ